MQLASRLTLSLLFVVLGGLALFFFFHHGLSLFALGSWFGGEAPGGGGTAQAGVAPEIPAGETLGQGFVVWESNRGGEWQLWRRELDGSGLRRLTPQQGGLESCCAHISPDGSALAYLRYPPHVRRGRRTSPPQAALHLLRFVASDRPADGTDGVLVAQVRLPSEERAVVWRSPDELLYIDADGHTQLLNAKTGARRRLTAQPHAEDGWLMNPTLTHATTGWPTFSPYDHATRAVAERAEYGGCQPYFSHDGRWGFWVAGAGGPINRIDLATRQVSTVLAKNDPRLPPGQGYLYFPMLSRGGELLAFAASPDEHDFRKSNYDVFVVETDPRTLEPLGKAVRLTSHPATDRFPDVFAPPLKLGRHFGEAPFSVNLGAKVETQEAWRWDFGDEAGESTQAEHTYRQAGTFEIQARRGDQRLHGRVTVAAPAPPQVVTAELEGEARIRVTFDEEVELAGLKLRLVPEDGALTAPDVEAEPRDTIDVLWEWHVGRDHRSLIVTLDEPLDRPARLWLDGVVDRAQRPNPMPAASVEIEPPLWPSRRRDLVFLWETADAPNLVPDLVPDLAPGSPDSAPTGRTYALRPRGRARLNRDFAMRLGGGTFVADPEAGVHVATGLKDTNQLTLELTLQSAPQPSQPADLVAFAQRRPEQENFTLYEERRRLFLRLRDTAVELLPLPAPSRSTHVALTYSPGQLRTYLDGELQLESEAMQGDFFRFKPRPLVFGAGAAGERDWAGTVEGVAIYNRVLSAAEIRENARRYREMREARPKVSTAHLTGVLRQTSRPPTLDEIAPYREALVVYEYQVVEVETGDVAAGTTVSVAHWAVLDNQIQPVTRRRPGGTYSLRLEPFSAHRQLDSVYLAQTLTRDTGVSLYYDVE